MAIQPNSDTSEGVTLFHPGFRLHDYQADFAARCYLNPSTLLAADTGTGKSIISMAAACMLMEDKKIDLALFGCESVKVGEWFEDLSTKTGLHPIIYRGSPKQREALRNQISEGRYNAVVGVFETLRNDLCVKETYGKNKRGYRWTPGPLMETLKPLRVFYLADEAAAKMGASRGSWMYKAHQMFREKVDVKMVAISATPVDRDPEGYFNLGRLLTDLGTVEKFYEDHVASYDLYRKPIQFKNLYADMTEPGRISLKEKLDPILLVKSKNDPDIIASFPSVVQDYTYVTLSPEEAAFHSWILDTYSDGDSEGNVYTVLRQISGHPMALTRSKGDLAKTIVEDYGLEHLAKLPASKAEAFVHRVKVLKSQGEQVVAFTFFGQSILPILGQMLRDEGISVSENHGALDTASKEEAQKQFKSGQTDVFLSSDAGSRGINLPNARYVEEFDFPLKNSIHVQRVNRIHRLDSKHPTVFFHAWAVRDTLEEGIINTMLNRKDYADQLVVKDALSTEDLKRLLKQKRGST